MPATYCVRPVNRPCRNDIGVDQINVGGVTAG